MTPELKKLLVSPILGGMLVLFLPIIVWPLLAQALWVHFSPRIKLFFRPAPVAMGVAYFAGKPEEGSRESKAMEKLADEIASKR
jgi:hypothetical protein